MANITVHLHDGRRVRLVGFSADQVVQLEELVASRRPQTIPISGANGIAVQIQNTDVARLEVQP